MRRLWAHRVRGTGGLTVGRPTFILRRSSPKQRRLGCQFELLLADDPDRVFKAMSFSVSGGDIEFSNISGLPLFRNPVKIAVETAEPLPGEPARMMEALPGEIIRFTYVLDGADVLLEGFTE